jgi:hypothetical protein
MRTFSLALIVLMGTVKSRLFKAFTHCELYPYESPHYFALGNERVNKSGNVDYFIM